MVPIWAIWWLGFASAGSATLTVIAMFFNQMIPAVGFATFFGMSFVGSIWAMPDEKDVHGMREQHE